MVPSRPRSEFVFQEFTHQQSINIYSRRTVRFRGRFWPNSERGGVCAEECVLLCHLVKCWASRRLGNDWHEQLNVSDLMSCSLTGLCSCLYSPFLHTVVTVKGVLCVCGGPVKHRGYRIGITDVIKDRVVLKLVAKRVTRFENCFLSLVSFSDYNCWFMGY